MSFRGNRLRGICLMNDIQWFYKRNYVRWVNDTCQLTLYVCTQRNDPESYLKRGCFYYMVFNINPFSGSKL